MKNDKIINYPLEKLNDNRGYFLKTFTNNKFDVDFNELEIYVTNAKPGQSKGGHFHEKAKEWFTLIKGKCTLILVDVNTLIVKKIMLDESDPKTVFVPPFVAHEFYNTGSEDFLLLAVTDQHFRKEDTIPFQTSLKEN
jgi:dTDP-4-dehydrorhamnose 3,5-epimerase-like enzyme